LENLHLQTPFTGPYKVAIGNGSGLQIHNTGSSVLCAATKKFNLSRILHCPSTAANLLSINRFCLDKDCYFILTGSHFFVIHMQTGKLLLDGPNNDGLYRINLQQVSRKSIGSYVAFRCVSASFDLWHARLGRAAYPIVTRILRSSRLPISTSANKADVCAPGQYGKSKQLPNVPSSRVTSPLELVHSDVWVSPTVSLGGCRYYVIFIDDFTQFCWLYPLVNKSDVFLSFTKFQSLVENQFSCQIKQLQYDNGGEYLSHLFVNFLDSHV